MNTQVTNSDVFNSAMDIWIGINDPNQHLNNPGPPQYDEVEEKNTDQNIFVVAKSSLKNLISTCENHKSYCCNVLKVSLIGVSSALTL